MNFSSVRIKRPPRSIKNLSHSLLCTLRIGELAPLYFADAVPNDVFEIDLNLLAKFAPLTTSAFARMKFRLDAFFVPLSQIDTNYQDYLMNTKQEFQTSVRNGESVSERTISPLYIDPLRISCLLGAIDYQPHPIDGTFFDLSRRWLYKNRKSFGRLLNFFGLPSPLCIPYYASTAEDGSHPVSTEILAQDKRYPWLSHILPGNWSNLFIGTDCEVHVNTSDNKSVICLNYWRAYQHIWNEYYRDSLTTDKVDIYPDLCNHIKDSFGNFDTNFEKYYRLANNLMQIRYCCYGKDIFNTASTDPTLGAASISVPSTIVGLRKSTKLESFMEKRALTGNRFCDWVMSIFGSTLDNYEIDRPVFLGRSSSYVQISEVLQTSETTQKSPQASRAGNGNSLTDGRKIVFRAPDYGIIMVIASVLPEQAYFNGIPRKLQKRNWESFLTPDFAQIGMQEIRTSEVKFQFGAGNNDMTFGYSPRYSEYMHENNRVLGDFQTSLDFWHQSIDYFKMTTMPLTNSRNFVTVGMKDPLHIQNIDPSSSLSYDRIFSVQDDDVDKIWCSGYFGIKKITSLPSDDMPHL